MATIRVLLCIVCLLVIGSSWGVNSHFIALGAAYNTTDYGRIGDKDQGGKKVCAIAEKELGVKESVENGGPRVDQYNAYVGFRNVAWCASFVSWVFGQAGYPEPRTAWSPALFSADRLNRKPVTGGVIGIYFVELKRIAHCGIIYKVKNELVFSVEGNTNLNGSREGDGVYRRIRHARSIYRFADWLKK